MRLAVVGSRSLSRVDITGYIPDNVTEIVSGGALGIDACAKDYAEGHGMMLTEYLPQYARFGRSAPLKRNRDIVVYAEEVLIFWDGCSRGTAQVISLCRTMNKPHTVYVYDAKADAFRAL